MSDDGARRLIIYSHDTYGLGHFRRSLLVAESLLGGGVFDEVLIATGSSRASGFAWPAGCGVLRLPGVVKDGEGGYRARDRRQSLTEVLELRRGLLATAIESLNPEVLLVDHAPLGIERELAPLLDDLGRKRERPRLVLGLRDVIDDAAAVRREWERHGIWNRLDRLYDAVVVYGDPTVLTTAEELDLSARFGPRLHHSGYLVRRSDEAGRAASPPRLLVTTGGGGDGQRLLRGHAAWLASLDHPAPVVSQVVLGPFLSGSRSREISRRYAELDQPVELSRFEGGLEHAMARAHGVITMGGYNTMMEILGAGVPALIHPRVRPRREQMIRAERLAPHAPIEICARARELPAAIDDFVARILRGPTGQALPDLDLEGVRRLPRLFSRIMAAPRAVPVTEGDDHVR